MDTILLTIVGAVFASQGFWTWLSSRSSRKSAQSRLLMGLAFSEICRRAEIYMERGGITKDEYQDLEKYLYKPYKEMGGDGTAERLMNAVQQLPIIKEG